MEIIDNLNSKPMALYYNFNVIENTRTGYMEMVRAKPKVTRNLQLKETLTM